jgi:hypothetical protein
VRLNNAANVVSEDGLVCSCRCLRDDLAAASEYQPLSALIIQSSDVSSRRNINIVVVGRCGDDLTTRTSACHWPSSEQAGDS